MNQFDKAFLTLCKDLKEDAIKVLEDSLTYMICRLSINDEINVSWTYGTRENEMFADFMRVYLNYLGSQLELKKWCDAWGDMFMELSGSFKSMRGQFFTPAAVADLTVKMSFDDTICKNRTINDCACGSARMLLAAWEAYRGKDADIYLVGEDIDGICCKMAAVNLAVHGCKGEVIRHDSLKEPGEFRYGYLVNETIYECGFPSIRISYDKDDFMKLKNTFQARAVQQLSLDLF